MTRRHVADRFAPDLQPDTREDWMSDGLCAQVDPELWYPEKGGSVAEAKRVCNGTADIAGCPVKAECLIYALGHDERYGVWAGLSERERRRLRRGIVSAGDGRLDPGTCGGCGKEFAHVRRHQEHKPLCRPGALDGAA